MKFIAENKVNSSKKKKKRQEGGIEEEKRTDEEILFYNVNCPANRVHCDFCEKDITHHVRIICGVCKELDICVNCFANGKENGVHFRNHDYYVVNKLNFPLLHENWMAEEELLMLDGLERFGFGNWLEISEHIATPDKNKEEVARHYEDLYIGSKDFLPKSVPILSRRDDSTGMLISKTKPSMKKDADVLPKEESQKPAESQKMEEEAPKPAAGQQGAQPTPPPTGSTKNRNAAAMHRTAGPSLTTQQNKESEGNASEIIGYMPLRGDFDVEYDNDAELLLAEMEFTDEDTPEEMELKFKVLDIYNARLDERIKRKKFVIERNLLDFKKQYQQDRTRTKEEKEIYNLMKVFARFNTSDDHEKLVQGIIQERQLRARIEELRHYRKIGLKTFEEVEQYLAEKRKKDDVYQKKQRQHENFIYELNHRSSAPLRRTRFKGEIFDKSDIGGAGATDKKKNPSQMITALESKLCESLAITPYEYLLIKDILIRECVKEGLLGRDFVSNTFTLDKDRALSIFDFMVTNKMIIERTKPPESQMKT